MSLMVLGTASHVGKSTIVAGICRALKNRGIGNAPFKSQNMSLNSWVTVDGAEIGIAQAVQARAAGIEPTAEMNPVLLKPKGDQVSQVVLMGRPYKDVRIGRYYQETDALLATAVKAFTRLEEEHGTVVVEGAGGAAELNLYDRDIANIRLARALNLPILLVADIERGGVFAQAYGTIALLPEDIKPLVAGIIVNKFRGDPALFADGVDTLEEICGVPVLGVLPYAETGLPSEDSLSIADKQTREGGVRIAVLRLPHIANFTDFELLERRASVTYVNPGKSLAGYDAVILPGTKNTIDDLEVVRTSGTADEICRVRAAGIPIIGVCGGFQMLGRRLLDKGYEGDAPGEAEGLGLLDVATTFSAYAKTTRQVRRQAADVSPILSQMGEVSGYEIHMGTTERGGDVPAFGEDGAVSRDGLVIGTYLHGLFSDPAVVDTLVGYLAGRKGIEYRPAEDECDPYDRLAALFEVHLDMGRVAALALGSGREGYLYKERDQP
ncbi:adenosylcobyric acid synthase [Methanofollis sp. W23]|uniref:cobyric acid synthase n=1 Tax=Methanofollis sp. W23 TaxID=2817849 RepID=UPI001AE58A0B|nr:cobyric acid synthase [Methanofollis sp. W23]MBP2145963.1 adenosylcobyric acid synthase [Methanofollis sp. W23]